MGSFNATCGISSGSISGGERTGMVLIEPRKYKHLNKWFREAADAHIPVAPPVYGTYDDYGKLVDIERSPVVDYLESRYRLPITTIMDCTQVDKPFGYRVVETFYDEDSIFRTDPFQECSTWMMEKLGFEWVEGRSHHPLWEQGPYRVTMKADAGSFHAEFLISSNRTASVPVLDSVKFNARNLASFATAFHRLTNVWLGLSAEKSDAFNGVRKLAWMPFIPTVFDQVVKAGRPQEVGAYGYLHIPEHVEQVAERNKTARFESKISDYVPDHLFRDVVVMGDDALNHFMGNPEAWKPIFQMDDVMRSANRVYMPMVAGEQCGNPWTENVIAKVLAERAQAEFRKMGADENGDYIEEEDY